MPTLRSLVLLSLLTSTMTAAAAPRSLPFIEDDFARARAEASKRKLPLFIDVWAPW